MAIEKVNAYPGGPMLPEEFMDPTDSVAVPRKTAPRPSRRSTAGSSTLLDIAKAKGDYLLDRIEGLL